MLGPPLKEKKKVTELPAIAVKVRGTCVRGPSRANCKRRNQGQAAIWTHCCPAWTSPLLFFNVIFYFYFLFLAAWPLSTPLQIANRNRYLCFTCQAFNAFFTLNTIKRLSLLKILTNIPNPASHFNFFSDFLLIIF